MLILYFHKKRWMIIMKKIHKLKKERRKWKKLSKNTKLTKCSSVKFLLCSDLNFVNWKNSMRCRESKMEKIAHSIKVDISSSMALRKLLLLKKEWLITKLMSSPKNLHPNINGLLRSDLKLKLQIDHLNSSRCKWNRVKEDNSQIDLQLQEITKVSIVRFQWLEKAFL